MYTQALNPNWNKAGEARFASHSGFIYYAIWLKRAIYFNMFRETPITLLVKDIHAIAAEFPHAVSHAIYPLPEFQTKDHPYDALIVGWTNHWNAVFKPKEALEPNLVKALIASESSFNPTIVVGDAYGLMQIMTKTLEHLVNPSELKNHFIQLQPVDLLNPNLNICTGIRWLFRKKQIAMSKHCLGWREAVREFKGYKMTDPIQKGMHRFDTLYRTMYTQSCNRHAINQ